MLLINPEMPPCSSRVLSADQACSCSAHVWSVGANPLGEYCLPDKEAGSECDAKQLMCMQKTQVIIITRKQTNLYHSPTFKQLSSKIVIPCVCLAMDTVRDTGPYSGTSCFQDDNLTAGTEGCPGQNVEISVLLRNVLCLRPCVAERPAACRLHAVCTLSSPCFSFLENHPVWMQRCRVSWLGPPGAGMPRPTPLHESNFPFLFGMHTTWRPWRAICQGLANQRDPLWGGLPDPCRDSPHAMCFNDHGSFAFAFRIYVLYIP